MRTELAVNEVEAELLRNADVAQDGKCVGGDSAEGVGSSPVFRIPARI